LVVSDGDDLAGEGGQVVEQVAEAAHRLPGRGGLAEALRSASGKRLAEATGLSRCGGCSSA
jgi:hypothetical protein